jgi:hypothetical protein
MKFVKSCASNSDIGEDWNHRRWRFLLCATLILILLSGCLTPTVSTPGVPTILPSPGTFDMSTEPVIIETSQGSTVSPYTGTNPAYLSTTPDSTQTPGSGPTSTPQPPSLVLDIPEPLIGVETHSMRPSVLAGFKSAGLQWTRRNALLWSSVEPDEGQRNWGAVASLENDLVNASQQGINTILIVSSTPLWAQKVEGHTCGPIREDKFEAFALFMRDVVSRYSAAPFNVKYWELGNEPDVDPSLVAPDSQFGCWGDQNDPYYGGGYYANMLKLVYPAIKTADPEAKILTGGLLLDCDPTHPPQGIDCKPSLFFKGMLEAGGANYFDILSFHAYSPYNGSWITAEMSGSWQARGGVVLGKVSYLREIMNMYGVNKPLFHTEGSLTCDERNVIYCNPPGEKFLDDQASYAVFLFVRNWIAGIAGTIWYDLEGPGWRNGSMLDGFQKPKPDFNALRFLLVELKGASFHKEIIEYSKIQAFEFTLPQKRVWVLWPKDDPPHAIIPPGDTLKVYDKYGNLMSPPDSVINLTSPVYFELAP